MKGEHQLVEWKESWRDEYLRWLRGFANAEGGTLVIGRNALIHKDYGPGNPIQIRVSSDSLWIWNNGPLPERWTAETLLAEHASQPANPDIARAFYLAGHIEAWGRGYERIIEACRDAGTPEPAIDYQGTGIWLKWSWTLSAESGGRAQLESQLESTSLNARVLSILAAGEQGKSRISRALGQRQVSGPLHEVMRALLADELIEMTVPERPNSRLQKYRLTRNGRALIIKKGSNE